MERRGARALDAMNTGHPEMGPGARLDAAPALRGQMQALGRAERRKLEEARRAGVRICGEGA